MNRIAALCLASLLVAPAVAQEKDKDPPWTKLILSPAPAPIPALKYHLVPDLRELKRGNAAVLYQRAHSPGLWSFRRGSDQLNYHEWLDLPSDNFPREQAV